MLLSISTLRSLGMPIFWLALCFAVLAGAPAAATTFTVVNIDDNGSGSLRTSIDSANGTASVDTIVFNIPGPGPHVIKLASNLPTIIHPLTIDGYTQAGAFPNNLEEASNAVIMVQLDALPSVGNLGLGLASCSSDVTIRGLSITGFNQASLILGGDNVGNICASAVSNNVVAGNFLGLRPDGSLASSTIAKQLISRGLGAKLGGAALADRNVIANGSNAGMSIASGSEGTTIDGNMIGLDPSGQFPRGSGNGAGISFDASTTSVQVGNLRPNLVAYSSDGIRLNAAAGNAIQINANRFAFTAQAIDLGNDGVTPNDPDDADSGANDLQNFPVITSATRTASGLKLQGSLDRPSGFGSRNYTITAYASAACAGNGNGRGERLLGSFGVVLIAGVETFTRTISAIGPLPLGTVITTTATDVNGSTSEMSECVTLIEDPASLVVTNTNDSGSGSLRDAMTQANADPDANVISFNIPGAGPHVITPLSVLPTITESVLIDGYTQAGAAVNTQNGFSDAVIKIQLNAGPGLPTTAQGLATCASNVGVRGLSITNFMGGSLDFGQQNDTVFCASTLSGGVAEGNFLGLAPNGVLQSNQADRNLGLAKGVTKVGGPQPAQRNVIASGSSAGILIFLQASGSSIDGNSIGTDPSGLLARSGGGDGIRFNTSGGAVSVGAIKPNVIAFSLHGIGFRSGAFSGSSVGSNSFFNNDLLGIDLGNDGVTANDPDDADSGPNNLQNFPELSFAQQATGGGLRVIGSLDVPPGTVAGRYTIAFYGSAACDSSGFGEGTTFLGTQDLALTQTTMENFELTLPFGSPIGSVITTTATAPNGSTSEFSRCIALVSNDQLRSDGFE